MKRNIILGFLLSLIIFLGCKQSKKTIKSGLSNNADTIYVKKNNQDIYSEYTSRIESDFKIELLKNNCDYKIVFKTLDGSLLYTSKSFKIDKEVSKTIFNCYSVDSKGVEDGGVIYILRSEQEDIYLKSWKKLKANVVELEEENVCQDDGP